MSKRRMIFIILSILWMGIIFWFSAKEADESDEMSHGVGEKICKVFIKGFDDLPEQERIDKIERINYPIRKAAHATEYALLAVLVVFAVNNSMPIIRREYLIALAICIMYASSDEYHQLFVAGRAGRIFDVGVDMCGSIIALLAVKLCNLHKS